MTPPTESTRTSPMDGLTSGRTSKLPHSSPPERCATRSAIFTQPRAGIRVAAAYRIQNQQSSALIKMPGLTFSSHLLLLLAPCCPTQSAAAILIIVISGSISCQAESSQGERLSRRVRSYHSAWVSSPEGKVENPYRINTLY